MNQDSPIPVRHLWLKRLWFSLTSRFIFGVFALFTGLWSMIKWGVAPVVLLGNLLLLMPAGKFLIAAPRRLMAEVIEEAELPDHVWAWMEGSRLRLLRDGYVNGQLLKVHNIAEGQQGYALSLVHPQRRLGVGLNYIENTKDKRKERLTDLTFAEFTLACPDGGMMDLANQQQVDPIERVPGRQRLIFRELGNHELNLLAGQISEKTACRTRPETLERLQNDLQGILNEEFDAGMAAQMEGGFLKTCAAPDRLRLTWKGAVVSTLRTLWPTSVYFKNRDEQRVEAFCRSLDIDPMSLYETDPLRGKSSLEHPIDGLDELESHIGRLAEASPQLRGFVPMSLTCSFDDDRLLMIEVNMECRQHYAARDYVSSSECYLNVNNETLKCEHYCDSFDNLFPLNGPDAADDFPAPLALRDCLPLADILAIASRATERAGLRISEATLETLEQGPRWSLAFLDSATEAYESIVVDAVAGRVIREDAWCPVP